jgi:hypothetical protein
MPDAAWKIRQVLPLGNLGNISIREKIQPSILGPPWVIIFDHCIILIICNIKPKRRAKLSQIAGARDQFTAIAGFAQRRKKQRCQNRYYGYYHQEFYECKTSCQFDIPSQIHPPFPLLVNQYR